jgi:hypothetical protein
LGSQQTAILFSSGIKQGGVSQFQLALVQVIALAVLLDAE